MTRDGKPDDRRGPWHGPPPGAHGRRPPGLLPSGVSGRAGRWSEWARALGERHGRVAERHALLDLILVRRRPMLLLRRQRLVSSHWFQPRVNLTINPLLLRQTVTREQPFAAPVMQRAERSAATPTPQSSAPWSSAGAPVMLQLRSVFERLIGGRDTASRRAVESARDAASRGETGALIERASPTETPLQMVFRRAHEADQLTRRGDRAAAVESGTEMLLQRVVRQAQRLEERPPGPASLVTRRQTPTAPVVEQRAAEFHAPPAVAAPWGAATPPGSIEQITDQVIRQLDRRLVATRERMGRF